MNDLRVLLAFLFAVIFCTGWALFGGLVAGASKVRKEAVKVGAAEYVLVNGGPDVEFRWKTQTRKDESK